VPLYGTVLFKVMKQLRLHEGCIEQIDRYSGRALVRVPGRRGAAPARRRLGAVARSAKWKCHAAALLTTETMGELADLAEYKKQFLRLFGFGIDGVDYSAGRRPARRGRG
jgi:enoyl-[acyl-carrier protein] reductase/trans-2-enoyl-CoA reductase (NAD+)